MRHWRAILRKQKHLIRVKEASDTKRAVQSIFTEQCNVFKKLQLLNKRSRGGDVNISINCFLISEIKLIKVTTAEYRVMMFRKLLSGLFEISHSSHDLDVQACLPTTQAVNTKHSISLL